MNHSMLSLTSTIAAALLTTSAAGAELTVKIANVMGPSHDTSIAVDKFAELVADKSGGRIDVQHFPGGQLGSDKETYEALRLGTIQFAAGSSANLVTLTPAFEGLHLPFIFDNLDDAHKALSSQQYRDSVNAQLANVGLLWMTTFDYGFRDIDTVSKPARVPADLAGAKIRVSRSPLEMAGIEAFGGQATVVDWPEVYNALRFKIVDGEAQPFATKVSARHHELLRYSTDLDWQYYGFVILTSEKQWQNFPDWAREAISESFAEAQAFHRELWAEADADAKKAFLDAGGEVIELTQEERAQWADLGKTTWAGSGVSQETIDLLQSLGQ